MTGAGEAKRKTIPILLATLKKEIVWGEGDSPGKLAF